jgi:hypothetical protein
MRPGFLGFGSGAHSHARGDVRGNCIEDITEISRRGAGQIAAGLAAPPWPMRPAALGRLGLYGRGLSRRQAGRR